MSLHHSGRGRLGLALGAFGASALLLAGCAGGGGGDSTDGGDASGEPLIVGTTDKITSLDPAGSYDNGSFAVMNQMYPFLFNSDYGTAEVTPDIAESGEFTSPTEYTVKLKDGLKFANGNDLTSSDVKFTFDRSIKIADPNGPSYLLGNLDTVDAPDDTTVVFHLKNGNDQTWEQILSSPAASDRRRGGLLGRRRHARRRHRRGQGLRGPVRHRLVQGERAHLVLAVRRLQGLAAGCRERGHHGQVLRRPVEPEARHRQRRHRRGVPQPLGDRHRRPDEERQGQDRRRPRWRDPLHHLQLRHHELRCEDRRRPTPAKALAVRQAMADLVDRKALATDVYKDTYSPLYSYVPQGLTGAIEPLKEMYGDGSGAPDADKAKATLEAAGVTTPVEINLQYNGDHYGPSSADEYAAIKSQLEESGLFTVNLQQTEWVQYSKDRTADVYPMYQLGWFPDYSDADNYLTPFFSKDNFLVNHYDNAKVQELITKQVSETDAAAREDEIGQIQTLVAEDLSTLPLLQGKQVAIVGAGVDGAVLDGSFKFRYAPLTK